MRAAITVPATVANLGPGFDIFAIAIDLLSEVHAERREDSGELTIDPGPGAPPALHDPQRNLVARAYRRGCEALGVDPAGTHIRCVNRIPFGRGLGSSAAAALGGVLVVSALHMAPWDKDAILSLAGAIEGHPENAAAALHGGLSISVPEGPTVTMRAPDQLRCVVFIPEAEQLTERARLVVGSGFSRADAIFNAARCALLVRAFAEGDFSLLAVALEDRWHQPARSALFPALPELIAAALAAGARGACLCGSGPSVLAFVEGTTDPVVSAFENTASVLGVPGTVIVRALRNHGARVDARP